jgi:hypothetical protein
LLVVLGVRWRGGDGFLLSALSRRGNPEATRFALGPATPRDIGGINFPCAQGNKTTEFKTQPSRTCIGNMLTLNILSVD